MRGAKVVTIYDLEILNSRFPPARRGADGYLEDLLALQSRKNLKLWRKYREWVGTHHALSGNRASGTGKLLQNNP